jgi:hypothetical protein
MVVYDVVRVGRGPDGRLQYLLVATGPTFHQAELAYFEDWDEAMVAMRSAQSYADRAP